MHLGRVIAIVTGIVIVPLALLITRPLPHSVPEVRLQRFTRTQPRDFFGSLDWTAQPITQAVFTIRNPGRRVIGVAIGQAMTDVAIVGPGSKVTAPHAGLKDVPVVYHMTDHLRPNESKQLLRLSVRPGSKMCRFRIVYWLATARERWGIWSAKWALARRYPSVFRWVSVHLPDSRREIEAIREVCLPDNPDVLLEKARVHNEIGRANRPVA